METILNIGLDDLMKAEILFFRNNYFIGSAESNFSYILWYDKEKNKVIVAKSSLNPKKTDLSYVSTYESIEEYFKKDLSEHQEHIKYFKSGIFEQIENFLKKNNKTELFQEMEKIKKDILDKENKQKELKRKYEEEIQKEDEILKKEELFKLVRARILEIKRRKEEIYFPEESLADIQQKINTKKNFTRHEVDSYAKNIIKMFWEDGIPAIVKIEDMLARVMEIDLKEREKIEPSVDSISLRREGYNNE